jgi:hypothetical protein
MFCATTTMSKIQQKAQSMLWYAKFKSTVRVQCEFTCELRCMPLDDLEMGSVEKRHSAGWPKRSDEDVDHVRQAFIQSLKKMIF